ncbi:DUF2612 domain-containing protein [Paraburkholderia dioscoreae]|jgi:hypothetical protein|uniref:Putative bacteriophage protein n=1 Tax=Paraburkholderia dioscoreae TaxID=2604047 RepID=A0A5Q4ZB03_9BURK|nr:DUF2612 domain-containing protein [Paraburkholderia dioscoreae]VVD29149.1 putative bacteriophage protein [Paraburkholderia dioscoreae]
MAQISDYTDLVTSEHADKPKFMATIEALTSCFVDLRNFQQSVPEAFDLDDAVGVQLDAVGLWVGIGRQVATPLTGVYFSLDVSGLGFDQGVWQGPFDPSTGLTTLDDETYRMLIRARIGANHWDGTAETSVAILRSIFDTSSRVFIQDHDDMSISICIAGSPPNALSLALLKGGYIPLKPETVRVNTVVVTTLTGAPLFGFDMDNDLVAGFETGAWGVPA